jgi:hypothetical protein
MLNKIIRRRSARPKNKNVPAALSAMPGQWLGKFFGTNSGDLILDLDDYGDHAAGHALAFDADAQLPGVLIGLRLPKGAAVLDVVSTSVDPLDPIRHIVLSKSELRSQGVAFPDTINVHFEFSGDQLTVQWTSDIGTTGNAVLVRPNAELPSKLVPAADVRSWADLSRHFLSLEPGRYIFRGQTEPKRLRTSFHRTRRKDLVTYLRNDFVRAHHALTGQTRHFFALGDPLQNAAFLNLLQHHGFPTPLLDWTLSPFVAAFFAYRFGRGRPADAASVRILMFDRKAWIEDYSQVASIAFAQPHFSVIESYNFENPRAGPQQSISTVTNLDDIEAYIAHCEQQRQKSYLSAFDLPFVERPNVMEHLRLMGITAASLFPGLDGACEELRGRFFHPLN